VSRSPGGRTLPGKWHEFWGPALLAHQTRHHDPNAPCARVVLEHAETMHHHDDVRQKKAIGTTLPRGPDIRGLRTTREPRQYGHPSGQLFPLPGRLYLPSTGASTTDEGGTRRAAAKSNRYSWRISAMI